MHFMRLLLIFLCRCCCLSFAFCSRQFQFISLDSSFIRNQFFGFFLLVLFRFFSGLVRTLLKSIFNKNRGRLFSASFLIWLWIASMEVSQAEYRFQVIDGKCNRKRRELGETEYEEARRRKKNAIMLRLSNIDIKLKNGYCCFMHLLYWCHESAFPIPATATTTSPAARPMATTTTPIPFDY